MTDVFISYARSTAAHAKAVASVLGATGCSVWHDEELPAHRAYADVIEEKLRAAKAVVVIWSADAAKSQWVRAEADLARSVGTLVQMSIDGCALPLPFNQIQCVDLSDWSGDSDHQGWRKVMASVSALLARQAPDMADRLDSLVGTHARPLPMAPQAPREPLLAVLAFENMSDDPELGYFSDGISEEILYTVAGIKGLKVVGRASSFQFRGRDKTAGNIVQSLGATHMLDGSVRRSGKTIRIHVELVDTANLALMWSERYDRALTDIFALQDEIAAAIATALNRHFAPKREALPINPEAHDLYLKARGIYAQDLSWDAQKTCVGLLERAVTLAPDFSQAWGMLGSFRRGDAAVAAARRGLELDPDCATSLAALAMTKPTFSHHAEKLQLAERAYALAPDEQIVAGAYVLLLVSVGWLTRACEVAIACFERDPLSPMVAGRLAMIHRSLGRKAQAIALADKAVRDFPNATYSKFIRGVMAIYDDDIDCAAAMADAATASGDALPLQALTMFMRTVGAMGAEDRSATVRQFLHRNAPTSYIVDIGLAAAMGEEEMAMTHLLETIEAGRPLEFTGENDGRATGNDLAVTSGLFMPNGETLRRDVRFAEVCVRLGLYDCWRETGKWPDCAAEAAPFYDLKAECARVAETLNPTHTRQAS